MKIVQIIPKAKLKGRLKSLLKQTERELRGTKTTFYRQGEGHWKHIKFKGDIKWEETMGGILAAEIGSHDEEFERKLLDSFLGYLDRHLGKNIESISISYR